MATNGKEPEVMEGEIVQETTMALARSVLPPDDLALTPIFNLETAQNRLAELQKFVKFYLKEEEDFGTIPGTAKPTLYKPGADKLCDIYGLADTYRITNRTEDWGSNLFDYEVECTLINRRNLRLVATGLGSCNSYEGKYRWRDTKRKCPLCGKETVIKGREEYGGGWLCWKKDGKSDGCGSKWPDGATEIESQQVGRVENDDIPTLKNTLLKMAKKRAKVDAVLSATRSSGIFTQDIEDWTVIEGGSVAAAQAVAAHKVAEHTAKVEAAVNGTKVNLPPVNQPSRIEQQLKESIQNAEEKNSYAVSGMLLKSQRKKGPAKEYMLIIVSEPVTKKEVKLNLFDNHAFQDRTRLWDLLEMASGRFVSFLVKAETNPKYNPTIIRVLKIHNIEFGENREPIRMTKTPEPLPPLEPDGIDEYTL